MLRHIDRSHTAHCEVFLFPSIPQWSSPRLWAICYRSIQSLSFIWDRYAEMLRLHPFFAALSIQEYLQSIGILRGWPTFVLLLLKPSEEAAWTLRHISPQCGSNCGFLLRDCGFHALTAATPQDCGSSSLWLQLHALTATTLYPYGIMTAAWLRPSLYYYGHHLCGYHLLRLPSMPVRLWLRPFITAATIYVTTCKCLYCYVYILPLLHICISITSIYIYIFPLPACVYIYISLLPVCI